MFQIKKLNAISDRVFEDLPKEQFVVSTHIEDADVDAYLVRSADCHGIERTSKLLAFARAGAGVNNIPVADCAEDGVVVFNTPGANANAVKEMVLCGMLVASRNVIEANKWVLGLKGKGDEVRKLIESGKKQFVGPEIKGKTLGVIGLGAIGVLVANSAQALGMKVVGYDPAISVESAWHLSQWVNRAEKLDDLLEQADYITIHIPLMDKTRDFLSSHEFAKMKDGVILMNFARNGIINRATLFEAIETGKVAKYVSDFPGDEILDHKNVIAIPHLGASTPESEENCAAMAAQELHDFLLYGSIVNSVNMPKCVLAAPSGYRITLIHKNLAGMVGQVTGVIAGAGLNIAEMVNKSRGDIAYTVLDLDSEASDDVLAALEAIDGVIKVREIAPLA